ncbi:putative RNA methyltransferase [Alcaligenes faecalis]|uniref:putative RNA methyltransferase n=1 Tax=Alcaligenes faecalis TaxID=511 RepID=UPI00293387DD|nr:methyltransferase domain-containing protein [Alcaligenes faecalis]MDV2116501.1 methyltransferase domain-containing protein [Alcaligenes faecalis]
MSDFSPPLFEQLCCPLDGLPLSFEAPSWRCPAGHCFDTASQGYINLLPVQNKRSRDPGDSKEMVAARRRYLESGVYEPIAAGVWRILMDELEGEAPYACLDAGCGEGYYPRYLRQQDKNGQLALIGLDISKWAAMAAARSSPDIRWLVGSNAQLPVPDGALDAVLCMFGFAVPDEFLRALKPGGIWVQVQAGADHLLALRRIIYTSLKLDKSQEQTVAAGFSLERSERICFEVSLSTQQQIADLLLMTPHMFRASMPGLERVRQLTSLDLQVDVQVKVLRRL